MLVIYNSLILTNKTYKTIKTRNTGIPLCKIQSKKIPCGYYMVTTWYQDAEELCIELIDMRYIKTFRYTKPKHLKSPSKMNLPFPLSSIRIASLNLYRMIEPACHNRSNKNVAGQTSWWASLLRLYARNRVPDCPS